MPHREELTEQDVLAELARAREPRSLRELAGALRLKHDGRRALAKIVARLKRKGEIEEARQGRYRLAGQRPSGGEKPEPAGGGMKPPLHKTVPGRVASGRGGREKTAQARVPRQGSGQVPVPPGRDANVIRGRLVAHRDGYGFVVPDEAVAGMEGDLFIGRDALGDAMHGDRVLARIERRGRPRQGAAGAAGMGRWEGRIVRVEERAHPTIVGLFRYGSQGNTVLPYDVRLLHEILIPPGDELTPQLKEAHREQLGPDAARRPRRLRLAELDGAVVNVELTRFPRGGVAPAGRVVEIVGRPGEIGVDTEIIIRKHHLPFEFSVEAIEEAQRVARPVAAGDLEGREDFRALPIVTIDGETARDFDDAVHVERLSGGRWRLQVHIADVAHYVRRGGALDGDARLRGNSVYFPARAVPMLPEALSNDICSLNPKVDRLVMSVVMEFDAAGATLDARFTAGVIRSAERMTYTNVNKVIEGDPEMSARYAALAGHFREMKELALVLNARRSSRGSIDFDLPERIIEFDEVGRMTGVVRSERNIAHRLIEEFMLAANQAVARHLEGRAIASVHRVHEKPDPKKVLEFEELAHAFGYSLGVADLTERRLPVRHGHVKPAARGGRERPMTVSLPGGLDIDIRPQHYQRLTEKIDGKPEERILSYLMLRSLKQARYAADPLGHFALAFDEYTHFTSPIRRYPDLIVHRVLKWALANQRGIEVVRSRGHETGQGKTAQAGVPVPPGPYPRGELEAIAVESSEAERRADLAERELMDWKTAQFMEQHLGEEYDALVISVQKFGFFVELLEIFVEGLVPVTTLEELTGERLFYRERDHALVAGRGRKTWRLGDRLRVRADRIDPLRRRVEFTPV